MEIVLCMSWCCGRIKLHDTCFYDNEAELSFEAFEIKASCSGVASSEKSEKNGGRILT